MQKQVEIIVAADIRKEYVQALDELKRSFKKSIDIVYKVRDLGLKYGLSNHEIRRDIERALSGIVKARQLRALLPLELKRKYSINSAAAAELKSSEKARKPHMLNIIEFRGRISKMGTRRVICVPSYLNNECIKLDGKELKISIS